METAQITIRNIPKDIRAKFKAACAYRGVTQQERIKQLIEQDLKKFEESRK